MTRFNAKGAWVLLIFSIVIIALMAYRTKSINNQNMRCYSSIQINFGSLTDKEKTIDAVVNFQRTKDSAVLIINGTIQSDIKTQKISREIKLKTVSAQKKQYFHYIITEIKSGPTDNITDDVFFQIAEELSGSDNDVFINENLSTVDSVLIGGPYSDLFMCVKY